MFSGFYAERIYVSFKDVSSYGDSPLHLMHMTPSTGEIHGNQELIVGGLDEESRKMLTHALQTNLPLSKQQDNTLSTLIAHGVRLNNGVLFPLGIEEVMRSIHTKYENNILFPKEFIRSIALSHDGWNLYGLTSSKLIVMDPQTLAIKAIFPNDNMTELFNSVRMY